MRGPRPKVHWVDLPSDVLVAILDQLQDFEDRAALIFAVGSSTALPCPGVSGSTFTFRPTPELFTHLGLLKALKQERHPLAALRRIVLPRSFTINPETAMGQLQLQALKTLLTDFAQGVEYVQLDLGAAMVGNAARYIMDEVLPTLNGVDTVELTMPRQAPRSEDEDEEAEEDEQRLGQHWQLYAWGWRRARICVPAGEAIGLQLVEDAGLEELEIAGLGDAGAMVRLGTFRRYQRPVQPLPLRALRIKNCVLRFGELPVGLDGVREFVVASWPEGWLGALPPVVEILRRHLPNAEVRGLRTLQDALQEPLVGADLQQAIVDMQALPPDVFQHMVQDAAEQLQEFPELEQAFQAHALQQLQQAAPQLGLPALPPGMLQHAAQLIGHMPPAQLQHFLQHAQEMAQHIFQPPAQPPQPPGP